MAVLYIATHHHHPHTVYGVVRYDASGDDDETDDEDGHHNTSTWGFGPASPPHPSRSDIGTGEQRGNHHQQQPPPPESNQQANAVGGATYTEMETFSNANKRAVARHSIALRDSSGSAPQSSFRRRAGGGGTSGGSGASGAAADKLSQPLLQYGTDSSNGASGAAASPSPASPQGAPPPCPAGTDYSKAPTATSAGTDVCPVTVTDPVTLCVGPSPRNKPSLSRVPSYHD